jgi:flagellar protein FlbT
VPLRIELKPFERIAIGESVIVNSNSRTCFLVEGEAPILREKDTVTAENANTPAEQLYLCVQMMYLKNDVPRYRTTYLGLIKDLGKSLPACRDLLDIANNHILGGSLYKALKEIRKLIKHQSGLLVPNI